MKNKIYEFQLWFLRNKDDYLFWRRKKNVTSPFDHISVEMTRNIITLIGIGFYFPFYTQTSIVKHYQVHGISILLSWCFLLLLSIYWFKALNPNLYELSPLCTTHTIITTLSPNYYNYKLCNSISRPSNRSQIGLLQIDLCLLISLEIPNLQIDIN